jgi:hypothetical protein
MALYTVLWIRIRDPGLGAFLTPIPNPESRGQIGTVRIRDPGWRQFGSGMEKSRIRDKHSGSATLKNRGFLDCKAGN